MDARTPHAVTSLGALLNLEPETVLIDAHGRLLDVTQAHTIDPVTEDLVFSTLFHEWGTNTSHMADEVPLPVVVQPFGV